MTKQPHPKVCLPELGRRAAELPSCLNARNTTFLDDICDVLLDPAPDPVAAEIVYRWIRQEVESELRQRVAAGDRYLFSMACFLAPRMIWKLPCTISDPPARYHRLIVAILVPYHFREVVGELAGIAFNWQFRALLYPDILPFDGIIPGPGV